jgi:phosphoglycolate phosphatase
VIPSFPVYLFDVDGTLVDSQYDICGAIQEVLATTPQNQVDHTFLRGYIGRHLIDLFQDLFPAHSAAEIEDLIVHYRRCYPARQHRLTKRYEGVKEALSNLGGCKSTATTKGTPTTRAVLERFGLLPYFDHVQGTDGFPAKPQPDVIFTALKALNAKPEDCLFVGDSAADMEAGHRAGVKTCAVLYGYGSREDLAKWKPSYWITDLRQLCSSAQLSVANSHQPTQPDQSGHEVSEGA